MHTSRHSFRFNAVFLFFIFCLVVFAVKLVLIQVFNSAYLARLAEKQHNFAITLEPKRGTIYDAKLKPLALNVAAYSLYANPRAMSKHEKEQAVKHLPAVLNVSADALTQSLSKKKYFVWLARKMPPEKMEQIKALKITGLNFIKESKRYYPNQWLAAQLIGFAGTDNVGLEGLEMAYDKYLKGEPGLTEILRDAKQRELLLERNFVAPKDGFDLVLTIDETIQYIAERALDRMFKRYPAKGAIIIVMNPKTGEILALANRPTFDLSHPSSGGPEAHRNRAITDMYEPGSVFKIVTAAAALESGRLSEKNTFFCENGSYRVGNHILHDHHSHGTLTFSQVFEQSSNIGVTKIAQTLGPATIYKYAKLFRFGMRTGINLPGEVVGVLKPPAVWSKTSIGAIPIGQEVTVTAIQLACAISTIANDGVYMQPFVIKYIKDQKGELIKEYKPSVVAQVINPDTALRVRKILMNVIELGTGKLAKIKGVFAGGKTGTAQKVVGGTYSHSQFYASFIGFAPVENPQLAIAVVFDEPRGSYYGGTVAAPVFKETVENALKYLSSSK